MNLFKKLLPYPRTYFQSRAEMYFQRYYSSNPEGLLWKVLRWGCKFWICAAIVNYISGKLLAMQRVNRSIVLLAAESLVADKLIPANVITELEVTGTVFNEKWKSYILKRLKGESIPVPDLPEFDPESDIESDLVKSTIKNPNGLVAIYALYEDFYGFGRSKCVFSASDGRSLTDTFEVAGPGHCGTVEKLIETYIVNLFNQKYGTNYTCSELQIAKRAKTEPVL